MDSKRRFGENLLRCRQARKLSQEALAERASIHRTQISLWENGARQPVMETLIKLAAALEVPLEQLVEGITWEIFPYPSHWVVVDPPELPRFKPPSEHA
jgi:transcriptional regulator with XRE-family HTH domain